ncbi:hypothetical protein [Xenorhabdus doucetiae]
MQHKEIVMEAKAETLAQEVMVMEGMVAMVVRMEGMGGMVMALAMGEMVETHQEATETVEMEDMAVPMGEMVVTEEMEVVLEMGEMAEMEDMVVKEEKVVKEARMAGIMDMMARMGIYK